ncbi:MAG: hypothetical protein K6T77_03725 [candidate division WOR-3 bacterium]|jgi:hypothetical protein|nr:hypothetical protein [candidate division WOR-3 bacterium]MCR4422955.1 hypothetical protein [candidate division WOR-3 bacterium]MDH7518294.1 hypothetical protein [bacterium]
MPKSKIDIPKFDEDLNRVEFEELERVKRRNRRIGNTIIFFIILAGLFWFGWRLYQHYRKPNPAPQPTEVEGPNIWVPGIDYKQNQEEGD